MRYEEIAERVCDIPFMTPEQGRRIYDHVLTGRCRRILDLGTAHGVSAAYMAAALDANGGPGLVTTVDHALADFHPGPEEVLSRAGVLDRVQVVRRYSSYTWFLMREVERRSDRSGNCRPFYDFCYLDGAKNWTIDGLAALLAEKLLVPGGWLLLDDLGWTYAEHSTSPHVSDGVTVRTLSPEERETPHVRAVFDLIVRQHPAFCEFRVEDDWWAWARKGEGVRTLTITSTRSMEAVVLGTARRVRRGIARALRP